MLRRLLKKNRQLICFAIIGFFSTLVHGAVLVVAVENFFFPVTASHLLAFCTANVFSYFMNSRLTFGAPLSWVRYVRFFAASLLSLGMTLLIARLTENQGVHYLLGFALIVVLVPVLSFLVMRFWTFAGIHKTP